MTFRIAVSVALLCAFVTASACARNAPHVPGPALPNHRLTPGARFAVGKATICQSGYSARVRNVPTSEKNADYAEYGLKRVAYAYEVDHLVSLELGGSNAIANLWPEHYYDPGARARRIASRTSCTSSSALGSCRSSRRSSRRRRTGSRRTSGTSRLRVAARAAPRRRSRPRRHRRPRVILLVRPRSATTAPSRTRRTTRVRARTTTASRSFTPSAAFR